MKTDEKLDYIISKLIALEARIEAHSLTLSRIANQLPIKRRAKATDKIGDRFLQTFLSPHVAKYFEAAELEYFGEQFPESHRIVSEHLELQNKVYGSALSTAAKEEYIKAETSKAA